MLEAPGIFVGSLGYHKRKEAGAMDFEMKQLWLSFEFLQAGLGCHRVSPSFPWLQAMPRVAILLCMGLKIILPEGSAHFCNGGKQHHHEDIMLKSEEAKRLIHRDCIHHIMLTMFAAKRVL